MWSQTFNTGWVLDQIIGATGGFTAPLSPSSSAGSFLSTGDGTTGASGSGFYALGRPLRVVQGATTLYGRVTAASVASGVTTVSFSTGLAGAALSTSTALTSAAVSPVTPDARSNGHIVVTGSTLPATSSLSAFVSSATPTGNDTRGFITVITATTGPTAGANLCTVSFSSAYATAPVVVVTQANTNTAVFQVNSITTTGFILENQTTLSAGATYIANFIVIG